jgi:hypothetical protein
MIGCKDDSGGAEDGQEQNGKIFQAITTSSDIAASNGAPLRNGGTSNSTLSFLFFRIWTK